MNHLGRIATTTDLSASNHQLSAAPVVLYMNITLGAFHFHIPITNTSAEKLLEFCFSHYHLLSSSSPQIL